ncbi:MAG: hypothetical protein WCJ30_27935, partial [Deltaproteobacteria bacterium]
MAFARAGLALRLVLLAGALAACGTPVNGTRDGSDARLDAITPGGDGAVFDSIDSAIDSAAIDGTNLDAAEVADSGDTQSIGDGADGDGAIDCPMGCASGQACEAGHCVCNASSCPTG